MHGALCSILRAGDHVVASHTLFGSCFYVLEEVLTKFDVEVSFVDGLDLDQWEKLLGQIHVLYFLRQFLILR